MGEDAILALEYARVVVQRGPVIDVDIKCGWSRHVAKFSHTLTKMARVLDLPVSCHVGERAVWVWLVGYNVMRWTRSVTDRLSCH